MARSVKIASLTDFSLQATACFNAAMSGDLVRIVKDNQEVYLIGPELFQLFTKCLLNYKLLITK